MNSEVFPPFGGDLIFAVWVPFSNLSILMRWSELNSFLNLCPTVEVREFKVCVIISARNWAAKLLQRGLGIAEN